MSFVSSKGNILCRLINIELYKIFAIINPAIEGLHCKRGPLVDVINVSIVIMIFTPVILTHWGRETNICITKLGIIVLDNVTSLAPKHYLNQSWIPVASFTKEVNPRLAKRPLKTNGHLANRGLTSLVKEATANWFLGNIFQWNLYQNTTIFIEENAFENVVSKMATILSQPQWCLVMHIRKSWMSYW